jgi:surface carbohydrate biosynthesis protein (TIGR04326 family)
MTIRFPELSLVETRRVDLFTVWDSREEPDEGSGLVYRWNGFEERDTVHSVLRYVEVSGERLRRKYLEWIHDLGQSRVRGKTIVDHLALREGFSYWWMTAFVEKSFYKSPISDVIRLLAIEELVAARSPRVVRLVSADKNLDEAIGGLCKRLGISYVREKIAVVHPLNLRRIYGSLPHVLRALISLRHLIPRWSLRRAFDSEWFGGKRAVFFCSYFTHLDRESCAAGEFHSHQWEGLPKLLQDNGYKINWLQHYLASSAVPTTRVARALVSRFNDDRDNQGAHRFLDAYLSWRIMWRALLGWLRLALTSLRLGSVRHAFRPAGSQLSLWPVLREEWNGSMRGPDAITNLLWIELFDVALRDMPHQCTGLYLCENQAWERALIYSWRKHGHGELIAVAHSTVRFWDLRYFTDPRSVRTSEPCPMPMADRLALNGKPAIDAYLSLDYPREAIAACEALRYTVADNRPQTSSAKIARRQFDLLILGDYLVSGTEGVLHLLEAAIPYLAAPVRFAVKPHPNLAIDAGRYPALDLRVVNDPLIEILHEFDVVCSSNMTSAAVDAYLAGLPTVIMLDEKSLNFSPLRGMSGVRFVSTPEEMAEAIRTAEPARTNADRDEFFFRDPGLPRWRRLLSVSAIE